jgi:hypothetical protein
MPKNKKQKEYSTSYEKKISINPMTEAFGMGEDESPTIGGALAARVTKRVGEFTPSGRAISTMKKNPKTSSGVAGALGGTGAGYAAGRYDGENSDSKPTPDEMGLEDEKLKPGKEYGMKKGGMVRGQGIALRGTRFKGIF